MEKLRLMKVWLSPLGMKGGGPDPEEAVLIKEHLGWEWGVRRWGLLLPQNREEEGKAGLTGKEKERNCGGVRMAIVLSYFSTPTPQAQWCMSPGDTSGSSWLAFYSPILAGCWAERSWQWISLTRICLHKGVDPLLLSQETHGRWLELVLWAKFYNILKII